MYDSIQQLPIYMESVQYGTVHCAVILRLHKMETQ
jgi:hypothetical protein